MKKILRNMFLAAPCLLAAACQMNLDPYDETENRLDFVYEAGQWADADADSTVTYTFAYLPQDRSVDTVWLDLETIGYVTDYDRPITLEQVPAGGIDAEEGKHYLAFDSPELKDYYVVPAGEVKATVPIVLKRDPSLQETTVRLKVSIAENEHFYSGVQNRQTKVVIFSDVLLPLSLWAVERDPNIIMCWGEYGPVKHRFMIEATAFMGVTINDAFIEDLFDLSSMDLGLITYWTGFFKEKLKEENARRAEQGLGPLREDPQPGEEIGQEVSFGE